MPSCLVNEEGNQQQVPLLYSIIAQLQRDAKTARTDLLSTGRVGEESQQLEKVGSITSRCKSTWMNSFFLFRACRIHMR